LEHFLFLLKKQMEQDKIQLLKTKIQEGIDSGIATNF